MSKMLICVTGKKGSGKSTFMKIAKETGNNTFIVDEFIKKVYSYGNKAYKKIIKMFGISYVTPKEINRQKLNDIMLNDEVAKEKWMNYINKLIIKSIKKLNKDKLWFVELGTYLLYEEYFSKIFTKVILIRSSDSIRKKRNNTINQKHVSNNLDDSKIKYDYIIENNNSYNHFRDKIIKFINETDFSKKNKDK